MNSKIERAAIIIHGSAVASAIAAGAFAQGAWFGADTFLLTPITVWMIISIGLLFGKKYEESALWSVFGVALGAAAGVGLAKALLGLFPGLGNIANAGITFSLTEAIGWGSYKVFEDGKDITKLTKEEWQEYIKLGKNLEKPDVENWLKKMPPHARAEYEALAKRLGNRDITSSERDSIMHKMDELIAPYKG
jgi:uncharacterized protein (DUF697 family)